MPVPKKRRSKSKKRIKGAHWKAAAPHLGTCNNCGAPILSHHACAQCGFYKGKPVLRIREKKVEPSKES